MAKLICGLCSIFKFCLILCIVEIILTAVIIVIRLTTRGYYNSYILCAIPVILSLCIEIYGLACKNFWVMIFSFFIRCIRVVVIACFLFPMIQANLDAKFHSKYTFE